MFVWKHFLEARSIPFREGGHNEVLVHCPFCGDNDPSQHLSISLRGRGWRCLRIKAHSGKSYARLLCNLIACSEEFARGLLGEEARALPPADQFSLDWRRQLGMSQSDFERLKRIDFPPELKPLTRSYGSYAEVFWQYLRGRGFDAMQAGWLSKQYRLQYAITGKWAYRLVVPIYNSAGALMTWTGRAVRPDEEVRYMTLSSDSSVEAPTNLLLGLDFLWQVYKPRCLVVTEGPFDAMAVTALGNTAGIWGTCLFGIQISEAQSALLYDLGRKFDRVRLLIDTDAQLKVLSFFDRLPKNCKIQNLLPTLKDPGELPKLGVKGSEFVRALAQ